MCLVYNFVKKISLKTEISSTTRPNLPHNGTAERCMRRGCYRIRFYFISTTPSTLIKLNNNLKLFNVQTLIKILIKNNVIQFYGKCIYGMA